VTGVSKPPTAKEMVIDNPYRNSIDSNRGSRLNKSVEEGI